MESTFDYLQAARLTGGNPCDLHPAMPWLEVGSYCETLNGQRLTYVGNGMWSLAENGASEKAEAHHV